MLKTICFSILPIVVFVLLMHFFVYRFNTDTLINFLIGAVLLIVGQVIFLTGLDNSIVLMGEYVGNSVDNKQKFYIYIIFGFVFGIVSTIAEPDLQVLASKIVIAGFSIPKFAILFGAGFGVGLFLAFGLFRIISNISIKWVLLVVYAVVTILVFFVDDSALSMAFDVGASCTGVITSPFLLALGLGVAKICSHKSSAEENTFGLIGISSVGPVLMILLFTLIFSKFGGTAGTSVGLKDYPLWLETLIDVSLSLLPLVVVFFIFEVFFIKISKQEKKKLLFGSGVTFIGFYLFLFGIELGFSDMGFEFGRAIASFDNIWLECIICGSLGFALLFCEPSVRILAKQIEVVTNRNIRSWLTLTSIAIAVVLSIIVVIIKIQFDIPMWILYAVVYGISLLLMLFTNNMFTAIAFDSSGVATGTLTVAFVFPIMTGVAGSSLNGFGTIGIMSMMPTLVMQIIGVIYAIITKAEEKKKKRILLKLSRHEDKFSNIENIKKKHEEVFGVGY